MLFSDLSFYKHKRVFVTGHTGFKGAWLCRVLQRAGALITGYALEPEDGVVYNSIVDLSAINSKINDIRNFAKLREAFEDARPEIVFHLAAQPLVLDAYDRPAYTFDTNVQGTVNLLECIRLSECTRSVVIITTDKVYRNDEREYGYRENDVIGGNEPYSTSKACAELVAEVYSSSYLRQRLVALSTARAGNVIGGGDVSKNRIVPDCVRSAKRGEDIIVRNPYSVRPYQHVLEPVLAYLVIAQRQYENPDLAGKYNVGPDETDCIKTSELVDVFCNKWADNQTWTHVKNVDAPHESGLLRLDCEKMRTVLGWVPIWNVQKAIASTVEWEKATDKSAITDKQIEEYLKEFKNE